MLSPTNCTGVLISCAMPAASRPTDSSFCAWRSAISSFLRSLMSRAMHTTPAGSPSVSFVLGSSAAESRTGICCPVFVEQFASPRNSEPRNVKADRASSPGQSKRSKMEDPIRSASEQQQSSAAAALRDSTTPRRSDKKSAPGRARKICSSCSRARATCRLIWRRPTRSSSSSVIKPALSISDPRCIPSETKSLSSPSASSSDPTREAKPLTNRMFARRIPL